MELQHVSVELRRTDDDAPAHDSQFQQDLDEFAQLLHLAGIALSQRDEAEYSTLEFLITVSPEIASTFAMILMTWVRRRASRSIRVIMFDDDVDLRAVRDFEGFVDRIKQSRDKTCKEQRDTAFEPEPRTLA
jgi:hypothetical protein